MGKLWYVPNLLIFKRRKSTVNIIVLEELVGFVFIHKDISNVYLILIHNMFTTTTAHKVHNVCSYDHVRQIRLK